MLLQSIRKALKIGSQNPHKINKNPTLDPRCPFCCSYGLPGLPQGAKVVPQGAKMEPPGLPNDSFGHQKWPHPLQKSQLFQNRDLKTNIQKPASQHTFQQINFAELKSNSENPSNRSEYCKAIQLASQPAAVNKGAGGRGEALRSAAVLAPPAGVNCATSGSGQSTDRRN